MTKLTCRISLLDEAPPVANTRLPSTANTQKGKRLTHAGHKPRDPPDHVLLVQKNKDQNQDDKKR